MGSFFASCGVTHTTIPDNMKTVIQLLIPTRREDGWDKGLQIYSERPPFIPFGFPISGLYADYGEIDNIVRDKNVERLEEFFNLPIEEIITACGRSGWESEIFDGYLTKEERDEKILNIKNRNLLEVMNMVYIHTDIYEFMTKDWELLPTDTSQLKKYDFRGDFFLRSWENIKFITMSEGDKESVLNIIKNRIRLENPSYNDDLLKMMADREIIMDPISFEYRNTYLGRYILNKDFIYLMKCNIEDFGDDMKKQFMFLENFRSIGTLVPSMYGSQENNFMFVRDLNKCLDKVIQDGLDMYSDNEMTDEELVEIKMGERDGVIKGLLDKEYDRSDVIDIIKELIGKDFNGSKLDEILDRYIVIS